MPDIRNTNILDIELTSGTIARGFLNHSIGSGDKQGNIFGVRVYRNREPVALSGSCVGYFIRHGDGETVVISNGVIDGNVAYVSLPESCYAVEGNFSLAIKVITTDNIETLRIVDGTVSKTSTETIVDPGTIIPSIDDLIQAIEDAVASIPPDYSELVEQVEMLGGSGEKMISAGLYTISGILNSDGSAVVQPAGGSWYTTDYVDILIRNSYFRGNFFPAGTANQTFCIYDASHQMIHAANGSEIVYMSDYPTAKYFRASTDFDTYYAMQGIEKNVIHIGPGRNYSTLKAGIAEAVKMMNTEVIVDPGVYDLTSEFATEIQNHSGSGIFLKNGVHVLFMPGSYVRAIFDGSDAWVSANFEPFYGRDFILEGLNITAANCRYCVHDEQNGAAIQYHNVYKNCVMDMTSESYYQCIGGGLGKNGYIEVDGGKYTSHATDTPRPAISYHNGYVADACSAIHIKDVYLGDNCIFRFGYYGPSTKITEIYVCGCSMGGSIVKGPENSSAQIDNFNVTEWNNLVRN